MRHITHEVDFGVVGGGLAGLCAAVAAARHGARVVLMQDRPVLGGNASSEIRMWVCGAHGKNLKETGIIEEIHLENRYRNPRTNYSIWDSVLYQTARFPRPRVFPSGLAGTPQAPRRRAGGQGAGVPAGYR